MVTQIIFRLISPLRIQLSGEVDAAFLRLSALEDAAQRNLLAVSVWIILLTAAAAAKAPVVEAPTGAARVVSNVTVLSKPAVGNAAAHTAATVASRPR